VDVILRRLDEMTSPARFRFLTSLALVALYINVVSGALVRVTNSGLGCPDWPLCKGRPAPPLAGHAVIEFTNRALALWVVGVTIVLAASAYRGVRQTDPWIWRLALAIACAALFQIPLGGITVLLGLNPIAVMSHFLLAILMVVAATVLRADVRVGVARPDSSWLSRLVLSFGVAGFLMITSGAVVTMSGTHPGSDNVPRLWNLLDATYWHVRIAVVFVVLIGSVLLAISRLEGLSSAVGRLAWLVVLLTGAQIAIGEWQWRTELQWWTVLLHVANATALWIAIVALCRTLVPRARMRVA
jgi:cytochrome c oxidase assembly protein subunit 15